MVIPGSQGKYVTLTIAAITYIAQAGSIAKNNPIRSDSNINKSMRIEIYWVLVNNTIN